MQRAGLILLLTAGSTGFAVSQTGGEETPRTKMSDPFAQEIRSTLPDYDPTIERTDLLADTPLEPGVIRMPEMLVQDRNLAVRAWEERARNDAEFSRLKRAHLASMSTLTALLNSWAIPFLSPSVDAQSSAAARRAMLKSRVGGFESVAKAVSTTDPAAGAALQRDINAWAKGTRSDGWPPLRP